MQKCERKQKYSIEKVLSKQIYPTDVCKEKKNRVDFDGDLIHMDSHRYWVFAKKGVKCVSCGLKGSFFAKERHVGCKRYHFNLYGLDSQGVEILFTKDHIVPKSKGGKDHIENYDTMCSPCNEKKGDAI